jgi:hypothetical protein
MNDYTAEMAHASVERGAKWLDKKCPTWFKEIDLHSLNLQKPDYCVLGQVGECVLPEEARGWGGVDYNDVLVHFSPTADRRWGVRLGFDVPKTPCDDYTIEAGAEYTLRYEMLTIAWKEYIRRRLELAELSD